jgi:hypothetical protein
MTAIITGFITDTPMSVKRIVLFLEDMRVILFLLQVSNQLRLLSWDG